MVLGKASSAGASIVGQGPTALAVGAGGVVLTFSSRLPFLFSFSHSGRRSDIDYNTVSKDR